MVMMVVLCGNPRGLGVSARLRDERRALDERLQAAEAPMLLQYYRLL